MMFVVFDMDGTLSDPSHRVHFLTQEKKDWDAFYEACDLDEPKEEMIETLKAHILAKHRVEIWTGRRESTREKTLKWLMALGVQNVPVRMRTDGDFRPDVFTKGEWVTDYGLPDLVYEDRNSMVEFYRNLGIACVQVAPGDF